MSVPFSRSTNFDLGIDSLVTQNDLVAMSDPWIGGASARRARISEYAPALPNHLGPWAAALELPGLDCSALGRH